MQTEEPHAPSGIECHHCKESVKYLFIFFNLHNTDTHNKVYITFRFSAHLFFLQSVFFAGKINEPFCFENKYTVHKFFYENLNKKI